jgi:PAS domain S-box-containing protein
MLRRLVHRHRREQKAREARQAAVAELSQRALEGEPLDELLDAVAAVAARELGADHVAVLELTRDRHGMVVRAGAGLPEGVVGQVVPLDDVDSGDEEGAPPRLSSLGRDLGGVIDTIAAPIVIRGRRFGWIEAHRASTEDFPSDGSDFLESLARSAAAAIDRTHQDDAVSDSEARFRELADTTPALMWMTDAEGDVTFVNEGWRRFTGGTSIVGVTFATSAHPDDREQALRVWEEASRRREEFRFEYRLRHAGGGYRWVLEIGVPRFSGGEFVGYVGTATDIDERRAMEESLRESEASFRELADTAPAMMWMTGPDGLITFVNEGWLRFTGTTFQEEMGASWALGVHPDDADSMLRSWEEALAERRPWEGEYRLHHHSGEYRWVGDRGVPRYEGGRFAGYVGTAIEIHERKLMEERLFEIYQREHRIAETLQRTLLPERLPAIEGVELAASYLPGAGGAAIGGDWYDVLERPDGRVALVVGDVVGHGLRAAASMGQLRNAFRAYGMVEASPAEVVARINRLVMSGVEQVMATVLYLVLDRETGELAFSAAGHPPPLVIAPDGARFLDGGRSVPIGATDPAVFREATAVLPPGSTLLLYTDGLVERRDAPLEERLGALAEAAGDAGAPLADLCERVVAAVLGDGEPGDDVALLAVRPLPTALTHISLTLPAEPGSLARLRRRLARFLHATGASELERYEVTLTICEAAGNAIEHAYGPGDASFEVEVDFDHGELTAMVRDTGRWREKRGEFRGRGLSIIEDLMDEVTVEREEDGTLVRMRRRLNEEQAA